MCALSSSDIVNAHKDSGLYKSATDGNFEPFKIYEQGLDHLLFGESNNSILHLHLNSPCVRSKEFVEKVLGRCPNLLWQINANCDIPLHIAAKYGHLEVVRLLIEEAKRPILRDSETGDQEEAAVRRMLRVRNKQHESALHLAITRGGKSLSVVKEILEHEDPNYTYSPNKRGESPLYLALDKNLSVDVAIELAKKFESLDHNGPNGRTVFHGASRQGIHDSSLWNELYSKLGSFVNQADEKGWTPLHYAAYVGSRAVIKILENDTSSAYATDKERNRTALHMASVRGITGVMKEMIKKCPECCEITDDRGWNVLHYAVISKCEEAVKTIMNEPSLVHLIDGQDIKGYTPLHLLMGTRHGLLLLASLIKVRLPDVTSVFLSERRLCFLRSIRSDPDTYKKEIEKWINDLGEGPLGIKIVPGKRWREIRNEMAEKAIPDLEKAKESHLVAAALVATVTFAAAFTLPGGYISDANDSKLKGSPILSRNAAFKAFVVTDAVAMVLSTSSVFIHFIMVLLGYKQRYYWLIRSAFWFIVLAMGAMVVAFVAGTYAVLAPNSMDLAIATCVIGLTFFVHVFYASMRLVSDFIKRDRDGHIDSTLSESLGRLWHSAPQYLSCGCYGCKWCDWRYWRYIYYKARRWCRKNDGNQPDNSEDTGWFSD